MSELGTFYGGLSGKSKKDFNGVGKFFISYSNVFNNLSVDLSRKDYVTIKPNEKQNTVEYGDIIFTGSSETREEAGMTSVLTTRPQEPIYLNSFCIGFRPKGNFNLCPDFVKHLMRSKDLRSQIVRCANGVTRFNLTRRALYRVKVPIPPIEEQKRIADILDRFDALVNDISIGLPAELEARRKQYEHYRDKLLDFKELPS